MGLLTGATPHAGIVNAVRNAAERAGRPNRTISLYVDELELGREPTLLDFQHVTRPAKFAAREINITSKTNRYPKKLSGWEAGGKWRGPAKPSLKLAK